MHSSRETEKARTKARNAATVTRQVQRTTRSSREKERGQTNYRVVCSSFCSNLHLRTLYHSVFFYHLHLRVHCVLSASYIRNSNNSLLLFFLSLSLSLSLTHTHTLSLHVTYYSFV